MGEVWTDEQEDILVNSYGEAGIGYLKRILGKSINQIEYKARRMGLGSIAQNYLNISNVAEILGVDHKTVENYFKKGMKFEARSKCKNTNYYISYKGMMEWLRYNDCWDSRKLPINALGEEPKWLRVKRERDNTRPLREGTKYTKEEELEFIRDVRAGATKEKLAAKYQRSEKGIERKISRLKEKWILEKEKLSFKWDDYEKRMIFDRERTTAEIAAEIGRTDCSIRSMRYLLRKRGIENVS